MLTEEEHLQTLYGSREGLARHHRASDVYPRPEYEGSLGGVSRSQDMEGDVIQHPKDTRPKYRWDIVPFARAMGPSDF